MEVYRHREKPAPCLFTAPTPFWRGPVTANRRPVGDGGGERSEQTEGVSA